MIRALRTASAGMKSQQLNVDTIANNIANINTNGYKKQRVEFKDLMYANLEKPQYEKDVDVKPSNIQIGHGVRPMAIARNFEMGAIEQTGNPLDVAIEGEGFFEVIGPQGDRFYTRDGSFKLSVNEEEVVLVTGDGYPIVSEDDEPVTLNGEFDLSQISIGSDGSFRVKTTDGTFEDLGVSLKVVNFKNSNGLEASGQSLYKKTAASSEAIVQDGDTVKKSVIKQGFIEKSNVQIVEEMVKLITAQRAYELNSKAIQSADEMLGQANNLRR